LPPFVKYIEEEHKLVVFTQKEKDIGNYPLELCASDGYAISVCAAFILSVEDPVKASKLKIAISTDNKDD
jgi:hypothetical protein